MTDRRRTGMDRRMDGKGGKDGRKDGRKEERDGRREGRKDRQKEGQTEGWTEGRREGRDQGVEGRTDRREGGRMDRRKEMKVGREGWMAGRGRTGGGQGQRDGCCGGRSGGCGQHHHHHRHRGGREAPWSPTATRGHRAPVALCAPRDLWSPACDSRPCRAPAPPGDGCHHRGCHRDGWHRDGCHRGRTRDSGAGRCRPWTAATGGGLDGLGGHGGWPRWPRHGTAPPNHASCLQPQHGTRGTRQRRRPRPRWPVGLRPPKASLPRSTGWDVHVSVGVAARVPTAPSRGP